GCTASGEQNRRAIEIERPVQFAHELSRARIDCTNDDTVGKLKVADSGASAEEFGIGHDRTVGVGPGFAYDALDLIAGADGNRRLCYNDGKSIEGARNVARGLLVKAQIREPVAAARRRTDRNEYCVGFGYRSAEFRREFKATGARVDSNHLGDPSPINWKHA